MSSRYWLVAIATAAASACADGRPAATLPTPVPPLAPALRVSGRMVDFQTSRGVAGISVRWTGFTPGAPSFTSLQSVSDATGAFEIVLPVAERFFLEFTSDRSQSAIVRVPGKRLDTDLLVNGGPCAVRYGTVIDAVTRQPVLGARITRAGAAGTDADGRYQIIIGCDSRTDWGTGTTIITAQHPAYQGTFEFDGRREFTNGSGIRRVDFALQPLSQP